MSATKIMLHMWPVLEHIFKRLFCAHTTVNGQGNAAFVYQIPF